MHPYAPSTGYLACGLMHTLLKVRVDNLCRILSLVPRPLPVLQCCTLKNGRGRGISSHVIGKGARQVEILSTYHRFLQLPYTDGRK